MQLENEGYSGMKKRIVELIIGLVAAIVSVAVLIVALVKWISTF